MSHRFNQAVPKWAISASIGVVAIVIGLIAWRVAVAAPESAGASIAVRPGMYNLKEEVEKARTKQAGQEEATAK